MELLIQYLSIIFLFLGSTIILIGSLGLLRLPDVFSRIHAVGMIDTAGIGFLILGMLLHSGFSNASIKLIILGVVLFFTSPISGHAVAISAKQNDLKPVLNKSPIESLENNKDGWIFY